MRVGRWAVAKDYEPNTYPVMASGLLYILSRKAVSLTSIAYFPNSTPGLWIEDAYLTGVLREGNFIVRTKFYIEVVLI